MRYLLPLVFAAAPLHAQTASEIAFAKEVLAEVQELSIDKNREYCGYIGLDTNGAPFASEPDRGRKSSCRSRGIPDDWNLIFSYHSHGGYSRFADSEVPSSSDILGDHDEGVDGWVVTPGGRMWFIDGQKMTAKLICGLQCFEQDPDFTPDPDYPVRDFYTLEMLKDREAGEDY